MNLSLVIHESVRHIKSFVQARKGEIKPPKLKTEDPNKSYVQRPVNRI
jgi:DnaJ homolog subfamily C member 8